MPVVDGRLARRFLPIYRAAFAPLDALAPARQSLTDDEFLAEMGDERVLKFLGWDRHEESVALAFMATDLSVVPWVSVPYFEARFPEYFARGAVYYVGGLIVRPENQGQPWAYRLLREITKRSAADEAMIAFDCCDHVAAVTRFPEMIAKVARRHREIETLELEPQRYYAYSFVGA